VTLPVRILSWNIKYGAPPDDPARLERIAEAISEHQPDIVCLQECGAHGDGGAALERLQTLLDMDGGSAVTARPGALTVAVLWRTGLVTPTAPFDTHYAPRCYHGLGLARLAVHGRRLTVASLHLHPHSPEARLDEASALHMYADRDQLTAALGDYNNVGLHDPEPDFTQTRPGNVASRALIPDKPGGQLLADRRVAQRLAMAGYIDACDDPDPAPTGAHIRIDWAMLSAPLAPALTGYVAGDREQHRHLSDHVPIRIDLDLALLADPETSTP